jgi:hypothetical protein
MNNLNYIFLGITECIDWHESKDIDVELYSEMFCAGHPDGHQDACLGNLDSNNETYQLQKIRYGKIVNLFRIYF